MLHKLVTAKFLVLKHTLKIGTNCSNKSFLIFFIERNTGDDKFSLLWEWKVFVVLNKVYFRTAVLSIPQPHDHIQLVFMGPGKASVARNVAPTNIKPARLDQN